MSSLSLDSELERELPERIPFVPRNGAELYGAADVAAAYCGIKGPYPAPPKDWVHGWTPTYMARDAEYAREYLALYRILKGQDVNAWGAYQESDEFARKVGRPKGKAIGLPIIYLPEAPCARKPGSLLVMPVHSSEGEKYPWVCNDYVVEIDRIRSQFSKVAVCVHGGCIKNGYWVNEFRDHGYEVVQGADPEDKNSLRRIQALLSRFEFVTGNGPGSQIAYGAFFGAKVSVWGPYTPNPLEVARKNNPHWVQAGNRFLEMSNRAHSVAALRDHYPFLFCSPGDAKERMEWGSEEVGQENKLAPGEMRELFEWGDGNLLRWRLLGHPVAEIKNGLRRFLPQPVKQWVKSVLRPEGGRKH